MPLHVLPAEAADIPKIVDIYFSAFQSPLVRRLKPNVPSVRAWMQKRLEQGFVKPYTRLYKVVEEAEAGTGTGTGTPPEIIAFGLWAAPHTDPPQTTPNEWPVEGDPAMFEDLIGQAAAKHKRLLGDEEHWYLNVLGTSPQHQRRGAGSLLMKEFVRQADERGLRAYLEASTSGRPMYELFGFVTKDTFEAVVDGQTVTDCCMVREAQPLEPEPESG